AGMAAAGLGLPPAASLAPARLGGLGEVALALVLRELGLGHQTAPSSSAIESVRSRRRPAESGMASGSGERPDAGPPPSGMTEIRKACRSAGSAKEQNCSTAWPRTTGRLLGPGTLETESANSRGPEVRRVTPL